MAVNKRVGYGILLDVDTAGGSSYTNLAALVDGVKHSDAKSDTPDITLLSEALKTFAKTQTDPGEVTFTIAYDPDEATTVALKALLTQTTPTPSWRIRFPSGTLGAGTVTNVTFSAHLTGLGASMMKDELMTCTVTLKKTGNLGF